jgi:hypothetical protein
MIGTGWPASAIDPQQPNLARVHDYLLGGAHNFGADRDLAAKLVAAVPDLPLIARAHRAFLHRAVGFCLDAGIRQFIDLGCGVPSVDKVHDITCQRAPDARVLYVDIDPVAVAINDMRHHDNNNVIAVQADLRHADEILDHPLLDLQQPTAVLMLSVLHLIPDVDDPSSIAAAYRDRVAAGSYLIVSHPTSEARPADIAALDQLTRDGGPPPTYRSRDDIAKLLTGLDLAEPGLVWIPQWRPNRPGDLDGQPRRSGVLGAAGRKPYTGPVPGPGISADFAELIAAGTGGVTAQGGTPMPNNPAAGQRAVQAPPTCKRARPGRSKPAHTPSHPVAAALRRDRPPEPNDVDRAGRPLSSGLAAADHHLFA